MPGQKKKLAAMGVAASGTVQGLELENAWKQLLVEFVALQEHEAVFRDKRERWMQMARYCVSDGVVCRSTETSSTRDCSPRGFGACCCQPGEEFLPVGPTVLANWAEAFSRQSSRQPDANALAGCTIGWQTFEKQSDGGSACESKAVPEPGTCSDNTSGHAKQLVHKLPSGWSAKSVRPASIRRNIWNILEDPYSEPYFKRAFLLYSLMIALSIPFRIIDTLPHGQERLSIARDHLDNCLDAIFTFEVLLRLATAPRLSMNACCLYFWFDVAAVIPSLTFLMCKVGPETNKWFELIFYLVPILRWLKVTRHSAGWRLLFIALQGCVEALLVPVFFLIALILFFSSILYWVEKYPVCTVLQDPLCLEQEDTFLSIPHAMWFAVVTVSTVGYGDVSPQTFVGRIIGALLILTGVCFISMPLSIVGASFSDVWRNRDVILLSAKVRERFRGISESEILKVFTHADKDGSGHVSLPEFIELVGVFDLGISRADLTALFSNIDPDKSGHITLHEFVTVLFPEVGMDAGQESTS